MILVGAGLDSPAYRFAAGRWVEIDELALIDYNNNVLPVSECGNALERVSIEFEKEKLADKRQPYTGRPYVIFVVEGVFMYLADAQKNELLKTLTSLFPRHVLFCDLMIKKFFEKYGGDIHKKLAGQGARFTGLADEPAELFTGHGYSKQSVISCIKASADWGLVRIPWLIRKLVFGKLIRGYSVYHFVYS